MRDGRSSRPPWADQRGSGYGPRDCNGCITTLKWVGGIRQIENGYNPRFSAQERQQHLRARPTDDDVHDRPTYRKDCTPNVRPDILPISYLSAPQPFAPRVPAPVFFVF